jgi:hypothetical protein
VHGGALTITAVDGQVGGIACRRVTVDGALRALFVLLGKRTRRWYRRRGWTGSFVCTCRCGPGRLMIALWLAHNAFGASCRFGPQATAKERAD